MTRNRASAKKAGTAFETLIARTLATFLNDDRVERRTKNGSKDRGDIAGWRLRGHRVVVECKDTTRLALGEWVREAEIERGNDDALAAVVIHKRRGHTDGLDQYVTCTLRDLLALLYATPKDPE